MEELLADAEAAPPPPEVEFAELYRSSRDDVYAYVSGMLGDRNAAEDVTAQAFERAYRRRTRLDAARRRPLRRLDQPS